MAQLSIKPKLFSAREVSHFYGVGITTVWRWRKLGLIPKPVRIGRRTFWCSIELDQHLETLRANRLPA
ncbi:MAG: helix-turn-helix transcriptional regulator [Paracoccaceae bacterium]